MEACYNVSCRLFMWITEQTKESGSLRKFVHSAMNTGLPSVTYSIQQEAQTAVLHEPRPLKARAERLR